MPSYPFHPLFDSSASHCSVHGVSIETTPCASCLRETGQVRSDLPVAPRPAIHPAEEDRLTRDIHRQPFRRVVHASLPPTSPPWTDEFTMEEGDQANGADVVRKIQ